MMKYKILLLGTALTLSVMTANAQERTDSLPRIKFEARCEPDNPGKSLLIVNDTCYYLVAPKEGKTMTVQMTDYGVSGKFEVRYVMTNSDEGREVLRRIPQKYNNRLTAVILKVYQR